MLDVKPYRQKASYCGPASLKMVLAYFGIKKSETKLGRLCGTTVKYGTAGEGVLRGAKRLGFNALIKDWASFADVRYYVEKKKIPVIVNWFSTDEGHYSIVVDIDRKHIYLQDPELGRRRVMDLKTFKHVWFDFPGDFIKSKRDLRVRRMIVVYPR